MLVSALGDKRKCGQAANYILDFNKWGCEANVSLLCTLVNYFIYLFVIGIKCTVKNWTKTTTLFLKIGHHHSYNGGAAAVVWGEPGVPGAGLLVSAELQGGLCGANNGDLVLFAQQLRAAIALPTQSRKTILLQIQV